MPETEINMGQAIAVIAGPDNLPELVKRSSDKRPFGGLLRNLRESRGISSDDIPGIIEARADIANENPDREAMLAASELEFLYFLTLNKEEREAFLNTPVHDKDEAKQAIYIGLGIAAAAQFENDSNAVAPNVTGGNQETLIRELLTAIQSMGTQGGGDPRMGSALGERFLDLIREQFGIKELLRTPDIGEALHNMRTQIITMLDVARLGQSFNLLLQEIGPTNGVSLNLALNTALQLDQRVKELQEATRHALSADERYKMTQQKLMDIVEQLAITGALEIDLVVELNDDRRKEQKITAEKLMDIERGDIGNAYELTSNLPDWMWNKLETAYPEMEGVFAELKQGKPASELSDEAKKWQGKSIYRAKQRVLVDVNGSQRSITPNNPILFDLLGSEQQRKKARRMEGGFQPWLDFDPLEDPNNPDAIPITDPGGYLLSLDGVSMYEQYGNAMREWIKRSMGIDDVGLIKKIPPKYPILKYEYSSDRTQQYEVTEVGMLVNGQAAEVDPDSLYTTTPHETFEKVMERLEKLLDIANARAVLTNEQINYLPTDVAQAYQAVLYSHLGRRYYEQYGVNNWLTRLLMRSPYSSLSNRSEYVLLTAMDPKYKGDKRLYFRSRYSNTPLSETLMQPLRATQQQRTLITDILVQHPPDFLQDEQSQMVSAALQNLEAGIINEDQFATYMKHAQRTIREYQADAPKLETVRTNRQGVLAQLLALDDYERDILDSSSDPSQRLRVEPILKSFGVDTSRYHAYEMQGPLGMTLLAQHIGTELTQSGKLWDELKMAKYDPKSETFALSALQAGVAVLQSLNVASETELAKKVGAMDINESLYSGFSSLVSAASNGAIQLDPSIRGKMVEQVREALSTTAKAIAWPSASQAMEKEIDVLKATIVGMLDMPMFINYKKKAVDGGEPIGRGPGVEKVMHRLENTPIHRRWAKILRGTGIRAIVRGDGMIDLASRSNDPIYQVAGKMTQGPLTIVDSDLQEVELVNSNYIDTYSLVSPEMFETFMSHTKALKFGSKQANFTLACDVMGSYLLDQGLITTTQADELGKWVLSMLKDESLWK